MSMKKLQMRVGINQPLNMQDVDDIKQNDEMEGLAQIFQLSTVNQKEDSFINDKEIENVTINVPLENIVPSKHNKFKGLDGEKQRVMVESIEEQGIIVPLTLRKLDSPGIYEIISGERRWRCAKIVGLTHVPAHIVECDEETAIMMLTEANLLNRDTTFYERVQAYKQQYDVMKKRSGERNDLKENGKKTDTMDILARKYGESRTQMYRYVKIADLSEPLIELTGNNKIAVNAATKLLELSNEKQILLSEFLADNSVKVRNNHAELIIKNSVDLSYETLEKLFLSSENKIKPIKSIKMKRFSRFFEDTNDVSKIEETIEKALQMYFERQDSDLNEYSQYDEIE